MRLPCENLLQNLYLYKNILFLRGFLLKRDEGD